MNKIDVEVDAGAVGCCLFELILSLALKLPSCRSISVKVFSFRFIAYYYISQNVPNSNGLQLVETGDVPSKSVLEVLPCDVSFNKIYQIILQQSACT
jgi:hypothetical protein